MPKVYLTMAEKEAAERKRFEERADAELKTELLKAKRAKKLTNNDIAAKAERSPGTVCKVFTICIGLDTVEVGTLRRVCAALGVRCNISAAEKI